MFFHPDFNRELMDKIRLWFLGDELVRLATYGYYFGEGFFAAKEGFEELEKDILEYAVSNFSDENGLGIAVNYTDNRTIDLLKHYGFTENEQTENMLELALDEVDFTSKSIEGIHLESINIDKDLYKQHALLWKGFDHEGQVPLDEDTISKQNKLLSASHLNPLLHVIAKTESGEYTAYCGLWYNN